MLYRRRLRQPYLDLDVPQRIPSAREMIKQRRDHLLEPHRDSATPDTDYQYILLKVGNVTCVGALRRKGGYEYSLQTPKTGGVILKAGEWRIAFKITVQ